ncbi:MAG: hypothetical protein ACJ762_07210, partial [Solirubrobacteraceae bacterium]
MGTSSSYPGSGGRAWGAARATAADYAGDPTPENAAKLLADVAGALDWDEGETATTATETAQIPLPGLERAPRRRGPAGTGDGPGAGGGGGG